MEETTIDAKAMQKAFENVLVLERIIGFLPVNDMRSCRLVNSTWLDAATSELRKAGTNRPTIANAEGVRSFFELWPLWGRDRDNEERPLPLPPFTRILLNLTRMHCEEKLLERLLKTVAPLVVELRLHVCLINPVHLFKNEEVDEGLSYPNLTRYSVVVEGHPRQSEGIMDIYKRLICGILGNAPNVGHLAYYGKTDVSNNKAHFHWLIDTLKERKCGHKKIKSFVIHNDGGAEDEHYSRMADELPELKLETVRINNGFNGCHVMVNEDGLFQFLQSQSESLKFLYLRNLTGCFENAGVPTMKKLETLHVVEWTPLHEDPWVLSYHAKGRIDLLHFEVVPRVDYPKQLPALKKMIFTDFFSDAWIQFMPPHGSLPVPSVEVLKLPTYVDEPDNLEHCLRTFSSLRILRIPATVVCANLVYKHLPQLEELELYTCDVTNIDDVITGFSTEECAQVNHFMENMMRRLRLKLEKDEDYPEEEEPAASAEGPMVQRSISVLKELKVLRLRPRNHVDKVELTKVSSRLVLAKMESLQILDLSHRSSTALENLAEVIQDMEKAGKQVQYRQSDFASDDQLDNYDDDIGLADPDPAQFDPEREFLERYGE